jgi:hypothetical protein
MEAMTRKPFQGVMNIIRFNWHFYVAAAAVVSILLATSMMLDMPAFRICILIAAGVVLSILISLLVSYYVYDRSDLYSFRWLQQFRESTDLNIINVHAGFDETSGILRNNFLGSTLRVFDFYDPQKHTEISLARARKAYPAFSETLKIKTNHFPVQANSVDFIFNIFALHEVRDRKERIHFIKQQAVALKNTGNIVVVEHLRDLPNFLAYNLGFLHFLAGREWYDNFQQAGLSVGNKFNITCFITVFVLKKADGNTP